MAFYNDKTGEIEVDEERGIHPLEIGFNLTGRAILRSEAITFPLDSQPGALLAIREIDGQLVGRWEPEADVRAEIAGE